ncbi:MAG: putative ABC transporter permease [Clostridia bacterium]|nr:putative ABC transporter permease [Clostridia bacterium]
MNIFLVFAFLFFIGCVVGWGIELFFRRFISKNNPERKWINPGFLVGPFEVR